MKYIKPIVFSIISYLLVSFGLISIASVVIGMDAMSIVIILVFLISYLSLTIFLCEIFAPTLRMSVVITVALIVLPLCFLGKYGSGYLTKKASNLKTQVLVQQSEDRYAKQREVTKNTELLSPTYKITGPKEDLIFNITFPVQFNETALKSGVKTLSTNDMAFYYGFAFEEFPVFNKRQVEDYSTALAPCSRNNTFIRFKTNQNATSTANTLSLNSATPYFAVEMYVYGTKCDAKSLQEVLKGQTLFVYKSTDSSQDKKLYKKYTIDNIEIAN